MRQPETVKTALAIYDSTDDAGDTVAEITARAITPVAVEMLDGVMLRMVEEATHAGYPMDAAAVLLIELEGLARDVEHQMDRFASCLACRRPRVPCRANRRKSATCFGKGRKNAFGAVGRVSPTYYVQDGVVPRTRLRIRCAYIGEVGRKYRLTISNIFHAGDGNMHPIILFDARKPGELEKAQKTATRSCILHFGGRIHHRRAWRRHGEEGADVASVQRRDARYDRPDQIHVRSGLPFESG